MNSHLIYFSITIILAMILGFVALGVFPPSSAQYAFERTPEENSTIAFIVIAFIILFFSAILVILMNFMFKELYRLFMVINVGLIGAAFLCYLIAVATFYGSTRPLAGAWVLSAFWVTLVVLGLGIAHIFDKEHD